MKESISRTSRRTLIAHNLHLSSQRRIWSLRSKISCPTSWSTSCRRPAPFVRPACSRAADAQQLCSTNPHVAPLASSPAMVQWPATQGFVGGAVVGIPRWHARGQGFKSPQLHQAQRIFHSRSERHLPEICQSLTARVGQDTMSADRFR
jgi:hypothetical protein